MSTLEPTMLLITATWNQRKSFRLIPIKNDCPFVEGIYDPDNKVLAMMATTKKETFHMLPKLDDDGKPAAIKHSAGKFKEQRVSLNTFQEYYLEVEKEISNFVKMIAVNATEFDFEVFLNPPLQQPVAPQTTAPETEK